MFCNNCGNKLNNGDAFCTQCGEPISEQNTQATIVDNPEDKKKANMLCIISLILKYGIGILTGVVSGVSSAIGTASSSSDVVISGINTILASLTGIGALASFVLMIIVRVKYPKNTFGKVIMWIYIIEIILSIIGTLIIIVACASALSTCGRIG